MDPGGLEGWAHLMLSSGWAPGATLKLSRWALLLQNMRALIYIFRLGVCPNVSAFLSVHLLGYAFVNARVVMDGQMVESAFFVLHAIQIDSY